MSLNEFEAAEQVINTKAAESVKAFQRQVNLIEALYDIRSKVAQSNTNSGITEILTQIARLDKLISVNQKMAERTVRFSTELVEGRLNKIRNSKDESRAMLYDRYNELSTGVATEESNKTFKEAVAAHKREKQRLQDLVLEANVRTEIALQPETENTLRIEGLI